MPEYEEQIKDLESELSKTKYNKRTQHHIGLVKAKLARIKDKQETRSSKKGKGEGYSVRKTGDATVILLGFPSVGKSTLLNALTNAKSEVASYDFTTLTVIPGLLEYNHAKIQVLDVPGVVTGAASGTGRGKEVLSCIRNADLVIIIVDVNNPWQLEILKKEAYEMGIRINQKRPNVRIQKTAKNGIRVETTTKLTKLNIETAKDILKEFRFNNADVIVREDITDDQLIDCIEDNKKYLSGLVILNKIDAINETKLQQVTANVKPDLVISAEKGINIEKLKELIFQKLNLIRIYMKHPGKEPDMKVPMIIFKGATIRDICEKIHRELVSKLRFARVWGKSAKFPGQRFNSDHKLIDEDIIELHLS